MRQLVTLFSLMFLLAPFASGAEPIYSSRGVAIKGYDPVAYFTAGEPTEGHKRFSHEWNGAVWRFSSEEHRSLFAAEPEKYAPAYGGWCAYAMAQGSTVKIDPNAFTLHEGRLFLNYSKGVEKKWRAERDRFIEQADVNYPKLVSP